MPAMIVFAAVLAAFRLLVEAAPLLGRVPVVVRPQLQAAVVATAAASDVLAQLLTSGPANRVVLPIALAAVVGIVAAHRAVEFFGVGEKAFVAALRRLLDERSWRYELRVDGSEQVDRVVLTEAHAGVEFHLRARDGHASLGARGAEARGLLADVVDAMEAQLRRDDAAASVGSRARYAVWALAGLVLLIVVLL